MSSQGKFEIIPSGVPYDNFVCYEGFWYSPMFLERIKVVQNEFKAEASDIILCSFPKSGTTWLKALAFAILYRAKTKVIDFNPTTTTTTNNAPSMAQTEVSKNPLLILNPHDCVKFLEATPSTENQNMDESLSSTVRHLGRRLLATHIPYTSLPKSVIESGCKIVYICRDPKDVLVSFWHFGRKTIPRFQGLTFQDVFEKFCQGMEQWSPIWDHVLGYWKAAHERDDKVLFLKYEDLKSQTSYYVKMLAEFLDEPFTVEEEKDGQIDKIIELCSMEHLRNLDVNKNGTFTSMGHALSHNLYFRKGQVGDWKNHLSEEMKQKLDGIIQDKFEGTGLNVIA